MAKKKKGLDPELVAQMDADAYAELFRNNPLLVRGIQRTVEDRGMSPEEAAAAMLPLWGDQWIKIQRVKAAARHILRNPGLSGFLDFD